MNAGFDKNMHGQYLGSATLIYVKSSSAAEAIKRYNGAQLDDRVMKIEYALPQDLPDKPSTQIISGKKPIQQRLQVVKNPVARRGNNAIQKRRPGENTGGSGKAGAPRSAYSGDGDRRGLGDRR
jgi:RNA recognition motif-containing protein